jgi:LCP family protein required for cell wall assembly
VKKLRILSLLALVLLIPTGLLYTKYTLAKPLDPPIELEIPRQVEGKSFVADPSSKNTKICGNSGIMKILEIGIASPLEQGHQGADAIRLIVVDFDKVRAGILALPADLWVNTPDDLIGELGSLAPLNQIYLTAYQNSPGNPEKVLTQKATQILAQTILDEFGFVPDKYINVNGESFSDLVDSLDGITITLASEIDASSENFGIFPVGQQTLSGDQTLDFVRILYPNGIGPDYFGRFERQNMVIHALLDAVLDHDNWDKAPELVKEARRMRK